MTNEYRGILQQLDPENRRSLRRMGRYIGSYSLNEVAYEELMSDLSGMALESQKRGQPFSEAVGMDEAAFCHELVKNCLRETFGERVLGVIRWILVWLMALLPAMMLLRLIFPWMPGECEGLIYHVPASYLFQYAAVTVMVAGGLCYLKRVTYWSKSLVGGLFLLVFLLVFLTVSQVAGRLAAGWVPAISVVVWLLVFAVLLALCCVGRRCIALTVAYRRRKNDR